MENGKRYVRRGEIYSISGGDTFGSEQAFTRPGLIISADGCNAASPVVIVAFLTTKDHNIGIHYGPFNNTGRPSFVCCEQIQTVSKTRLLRMLGSLSENQMKEVESRLDEVLDLGYIDPTPMREKGAEVASLRMQLEELKSENAELTKKVNGHADELLTRDVEIAVHKKMYEKAIGVIAAMRAEGDLLRARGDKVVLASEEGCPAWELPKNEEPKVEEVPKKNEPKLVDINTAKFSVLRGIGLTSNLVLQLVNNRPYKKIEDLKKVPGLNSRTYNIIEKKVCCIPVPVQEEPVEDPVFTEEPVVAEAEEPRERVNVNTDTVPEMMNKAGLSKRVACEIRSYRNKHGRFESLDELLNVPSFGNGCMKKFRERLTV